MFPSSPGHLLNCPLLVLDTSLSPMEKANKFNAEEEEIRKKTADCVRQYEEQVKMATKNCEDLRQDVEESLEHYSLD